MLDNIPDVLTMTEAISLLRISRGTLLKEIKNKKINYIKIGKQYRFPKKSIVEYLMGDKK